ncbi:MAG: UvrD-helicase domain-containing protein [Patescibacteria group bacterium]|nr:UvrD-helicase domain-containing protein [Patescibacteria group bacterium]
MLDLNPKQKEAAEHMNGPLLIVAGAGSGKTRTLTSRVGFLLERKISPENILAITFTNKAAEEMKKRVNLLVSKLVNLGQLTNQLINEKLTIGTFHSLGARILKAEAKYLKRTSNFTIFDSDDSKSLIKKTVKNFNLSEKEKKRTSSIFLQKEFSRIKDELINMDDYDDELVAELFKEYEKELQRNNAFDFDDLIEKPVRIFLRNQDVLEKYQERFKFILVDEYQDTNTSQYYLIKLLAKKHKNLSVVGDDQQSIFKFRGSDFRNFLNFDKDWPNAKVILLEQNYRSTSNIIEGASSVIVNNTYQKSKKLWTDNPEGELIKIIEHNDSDAEAFWVVNQIKTNKISDLEKSSAILYRTNAQSRAIEQALIEENVPYQIFGGMRFYDRKEIKDVIAALKYALNPSDTVNLDRLNKSFVKKIYEELKNGLLKKSDYKPMELIGYFLQTADYFDYLNKNHTNGIERIENVKELIEFAATFENLSEFIERISLLQSTDNVKRKDAHKFGGKFVNLMTVHLAKGMEFDSVYIIGANEGLLPHQMSLYSDMEVEEERRLIYVAMTRAKKELFVNFYHTPSRFLFEITPQFTEFIGRKNLNDEERYIEW